MTSCITSNSRERQQSRRAAPHFFGTAPSLLGGSNQGVLDALKQTHPLETAPKEIGPRPAFHRLRAHRDVAMAGNKYKLFLAVAPNQIFLELDSI